MPHRPWSDISPDFVTGLPPSEGNTTILTVVDRFSKMVPFIPLPKMPSAKETANVMLRHVFRLHGFPKDMVSHPGAAVRLPFLESPLLPPQLEEEVNVPSAQALIRQCRRIWTGARQALRGQQIVGGSWLLPTDLGRWCG